MNRLAAVLKGLAVWALAAAAFAAAAGAAPTAWAQDDQDEPASCLSCHAEGATKKGAPEGKRVDPAQWGASLHAKSCVQCHEDMEELPHTKKKADPVNCANCHEDSVEKFKKTPHAKLPPDLAKNAPNCSTCHPPHAVLRKSDPKSSVHKFNLPSTCGKCHGGARKDGEVRIAKTVAQYALSVHGVEVLEKHNEKAAGCVDCHPIHDLRPGGDPTSKTFKPNIPKLCATCHEKAAGEFSGSIHATALARGRMESPACNDCHSEHSIQKKESIDSTVYGRHVSQTCANCHAAERIVRKYGLDADRVSSYRDSYHGLADSGGSAKAANCASCHGFHDVRPSTDPKSRIHKDNLLATCQHCHEGATQGFIEGRVHATAEADTDVYAYWVKLFYMLVIPLTLGGMALHNGLIWFKHVRAKLRAQRASVTYVRFRPIELWVHASVGFSFIVLAITGFALTFPDAAWVHGLAAVGFGETARGWVHRFAGVVFAVASVAHVAYIIASPHGRYAFGRIVPKLQDLRDARQNVLYHLGLAKTPPKFDRWDYTMKLEYWALAWGGVVMLVTGSMLWFKVEVTAWMPRWMVFVAERIHYYEAILAVGAIIVWHFFFVIFHPAEYPMSVTWMTGKLTEDEMKHAHPEEFERIRDSGYRVPPQQAADPSQHHESGHGGPNDTGGV
ncbi:MAG: cytochrome b/b6 domain-containing protein [Planctomycetes bacterium]|nr:cytochrome b/b6 domain-containing protein [Planctomycetota bacterium]